MHLPAIHLALLFAAAAAAQTPTLETVAPFPRPQLAAIPVIQQPALPHKPLTITGARGAILGEQSGVVELWQLPVKVFSDLHLRAQIDGYTVPLDLNPGAATVEVRPGHTVLTYSFAGITVRQHMLVSPARELNTSATYDDPGALLYFEIDAVRPATLTVSLAPAMQQQWPAPQYGQPGASWLPMGTGGAYSISTDNPRLFGLIGMPNSKPGDIPVYQEHPQTLPIQFLVRYDPARDKGRLFPLLSTVAQPGETNSDASIAAMQQRLVDQAKNLPAIAGAIDDYYAHFFDHRLTVHTPDPRFDEALRWAELSIDDAQVEHRTVAAGDNKSGSSAKSETGLVAGWFPSFDSTRPGFGWYFGRDTLWSLYAIDSYGDGALAKRALEFLLRRQRADGKMMHEFSQMADDLPPNMAWSNFGYEYAAADATPLFLLALQDYVRTTGDLDFLKAHWNETRLAYQFERTHDSDGDGVYDNSNGTGWVENWQSPMPHQELYLASLDRQATSAMAELATLMHDETLAAEATATAQKLTTAVEAYRDPATGLYAFSKNADGTYDRTLTIYPAVALWNTPQPRAKNTEQQPTKNDRQTTNNENRSTINGRTTKIEQRKSNQPTPHPEDNTFGLAQPEPMLQAWSSPLLATDWGTRAVATDTSFYDPISYHQGSVWPLFTGWNAMAQYRAHHPAAAWLTLQQNLRLTFAEDPGTVTEVLSGQFYQPLGRSSAHQLWSSAMTLAPALRGLFGIEADALHHTLQLHPQLPVTWEGAVAEWVRVGDEFYYIAIARSGTTMKIHTVGTHPTALCLNPPDAATCKPVMALAHDTTTPLPPVEFGLDERAPVPVHARLILLTEHAGEPQPGDETRLPHITDEQYTSSGASFTLEALAGTTVSIYVRRNGTLIDKWTRITMPPGTGYVRKQVTLPAKMR